MDCATLRRLRKRARLTQQQLADRLGLTGNHVARLERGESRITEAVARLVILTLQAASERKRRNTT